MTKAGFDTFMEAELRDPVVKAAHDKHRAVIAKRDARMRTHVRWEPRRAYETSLGLVVVLIGHAHPGSLVVMQGVEVGDVGTRRSWRILITHQTIRIVAVTGTEEHAKRFVRGICLAMGLLK